MPGSGDSIPESVKRTRRPDGLYSAPGLWRAPSEPFLIRPTFSRSLPSTPTEGGLRLALWVWEKDSGDAVVRGVGSLSAEG